MSRYSLPPTIRLALEQQIVTRCDGQALVRAAEDLSARYRRENNSEQFQIKNSDEALAYIAARLPATYAANARVYGAVRELLPDFEPETMLDMGAGPATGSLAAVQNFPSLKKIELVEPNKYLREAGNDLVVPHLPHAIWDNGTLENFKPEAKADIVLLSYVLNEVAQDKIIKFLLPLWEACNGIMVIIEPGTPQGAEVILTIREWVISQSLQVLAPCPHDVTCPLQGDEKRWCHFSVRSERSKLQKQLKAGEAGYEDEKFSYLVVSRLPAQRPSYRVIGHPVGERVREVQVCGTNRAETLKISKSHSLYKTVKKCEWGDGFDG